MAGALTIVRPLNCLLSAAAVLLASLVAGGWEVFRPQNYPLLLGAAAVAALVAAGGNVLNDYYDRGTDRRNHPERPIPSGAVRPSEAWFLSWVLFLMGAAAAFLFLPFLAFAIALLAIATLASYESRLKRLGLPGNSAIAFLTGLLFIFGGAVVGSVAPVAAMALLAGLATVGRELVKDVEDMEGDTDRRTLPRTAGRRSALGVATAVTVLAVLLSPLPVWPLGVFAVVPYIPAVAVADLALLYAAGVSWKDPKAGSTMYKVGMAVALVAFLLGAVL